MAPHVEKGATKQCTHLYVQQPVLELCTSHTKRAVNKLKECCLWTQHLVTCHHQRTRILGERMVQTEVLPLEKIILWAVMHAGLHVLCLFKGYEDTHYCMRLPKRACILMFCYVFCCVAAFEPPPSPRGDPRKPGAGWLEVVGPNRCQHVCKTHRSLHGGQT